MLVVPIMDSLTSTNAFFFSIEDDMKLDIKTKLSLLLSFHENISKPGYKLQGNSRSSNYFCVSHILLIIYFHEDIGDHYYKILLEHFYKVVEEFNKLSIV
jgi:hypothetical protein